MRTPNPLNRVRVQLTPLQLIGAIGGTTLTTTAAIGIIAACRDEVMAALLVSGVIIGTTATVSLLALGRSAGARAMLDEIGLAMPDLKNDNHRNAQRISEILDAVRSITASYDEGGGGDTGPHPLHITR